MAPETMLTPTSARVGRSSNASSSPTAPDVRRALQLAERRHGMAAVAVLMLLASSVIGARSRLPLSRSTSV